MADKFHSDTQEKVESIQYNPGVQDTGDLEAATKTITATAEATGLANADYNAALTLPKPDDTRIAVKTVGARLAVTIDSFDTATNLYCRVYVDAQDSDHMLFDEDWSSTEAKLSSTELTSGTIFDLLSDGEAHTFYFFFWVNQANNAVISLVQLWEAVGTRRYPSISGNPYRLLNIKHEGFVTVWAQLGRIGTGSPTLYLCQAISYVGGSNAECLAKVTGNGEKLSATVVTEELMVTCLGLVENDLNYIGKVIVALRSEQ